MREDFNHDNAAIDAALHTQAAQTAAAVKAVEEKISLVRLFQTTLTSATASLSIDLSAIDLSQYAELELYSKFVSTGSSEALLCFTFNGDSGSNYYIGSTNRSNLYIDGNYFSQNRGAMAQLTLWDGIDTVLAKSSVVKRTYEGAFSGGGSTGMGWIGGGLSTLKSIQFTFQNSTFKAGAYFCLYGLKK